MKRLTVLFFLGVILCLSHIHYVTGDTPPPYTLQLDVSKTDKYEGTFTVKPPSNSENKDYIFDFNSKIIAVLGCKYKITENKETKVCKVDEDGEKYKLKLKDNDEARAVTEIIITYSGTYTKESIQKISVSGKAIYYLVGFNINLKNLLPVIESGPGGPMNTVSVTGKKENEPLKFLDMKNKKIDPTLNIGKNDKINFVLGSLDTYPKSPSAGSLFFYGISEKGYDVNKATEFLNDLNRILNTGLTSAKSYDHMLLVPGCLSEEITRQDLITLRDSDVHMLDKIPSPQRQAAVAELLYRYSQLWTSNKIKWLNLGLASFFARFHLDKKTDEKLAVDQFVVDQLEARALEFDGYAFSKALGKYNDKNEPYEQYDPILVSKGGSIMMTLEQICGDKFEDIFKRYVKATDDQKDTIDKFAGLFKECFGTDNENINAAKSYFKNWNENTGYPVIHVTQKNTTTTLQQEHFRWNGEKNGKEWELHITHKGGGKVILKEEKKEIEGKNVIIDNSKGYFRVNYAQEKWKELATKLKNGASELSALNRARLINDVFSLARSTANFTVPTPDYSTALSLSEYLKKEDEYLPLKAAFNEFEFLDVALYGSDLHKEFRSYFNKIIQPLYEKRPLNNTELPTGLKDKLKLKTIASWACRLKAGDCVKHAEDQYKNLPTPGKDKKILLDERQEVILCSKLRQSSEEWEKIFARLKEANDVHTQLTYITALGCSNKKENIEKLMNHGMSSNFSDIVFAVQAGGPENVGFVLDYMKQNIDTIIKKIGTDETENVVKSFYGKVNEKSSEALKAIGQKLSGDVKENTGKVAEGITEWKKQKLTIIGNFLNGSVHTAPAALVLLLSTLLPIAKYIFH